MRAGWVKQPLSGLCEVEYGTRVVRKKDGGSTYPVYGGGGATFYMDTFNREDCFIVSRFGMSADCVRKVDGRFFLNDSGLSVRSRRTDRLLQSFLDLQLVGMQADIYRLGKGTAQKNLEVPQFRELPISFPENLEEQRRIVAVLDNAFAAIATATANTKKNLANARALFESYLNEAFETSGADMRSLESLCDQDRVITYGVIKLGEHVAAGVPCLRTSNVRWLNVYTDGMKCIAPSLSREYKRTILKGGEVLVNVRGTLGGVAVALPEMHGWNVSREVAVVPPDFRVIDADYLAYWIGTHSSQSWLSGVEKGVAYSGINISDLRSLPVPFQPLSKQQEIVARLNALKEEAGQLEAAYSRRVAALASLRQSILQRAFAGDLIETRTKPPLLDFATPKFSAQVIAFAHHRHERQQNQKTFGHVKAQKALHLVESIGGIDLGRRPVKDAAGPNDFQHMLRATEWASQHGFFEFVARASGKGYDFKKLANYSSLWADAVAATGPVVAALERAVDPIVPMVSLDAEVFATVHAAWNNLLRDGIAITDDTVVKEARERWHCAKLAIPESRFRAAIKTIRAKGLVPDGTAKYVGGQGALF